jgi:hypothetical protein
MIVETGNILVEEATPIFAGKNFAGVVVVSSDYEQEKNVGIYKIIIDLKRNSLLVRKIYTKKLLFYNVHFYLINFGFTYLTNNEILNFI